MELDYEKAAQYFEKAAELGQAEAQFTLGYMYLVGQGIEKDYIRAAYYFEKAAKQGHSDAKDNLEYIREQLFVEDDSPKM